MKKLSHRVPTRRALVVALAVTALLAMTSMASGNARAHEAPYDGHLWSDATKSDLSFYGERDFGAFYLGNTGGSPIKVHLRIHPEESGKFLFSDEVFPHHTRCTTIAAGGKCQVIILFQAAGSSIAKATLEVFDGDRLAQELPLVAHP